ncbi:hypothetical protein [Naasia lichenicola]|uniref:Uncharacterized protein n=1 Tax=Naasia lichenicola TaxID=2565933 RepID=A0A4S4FUI2_9MICO|nr:hypothetical protein [Naasia lichenicola]THG33266.1 hypothetical protein E6C64_02630 [Naasia lichenicola]
MGEKGQLVETSIVAFLSYGNVIGFIQGSTSAPTPRAFEEWLNGLRLLGNGLVIETEVMVSHEVQQLLKESSEVSQIEVKMHTNRADALKKRGSKPSDVLKSVKSEFGPMTVTVTVTVKASERRIRRRVGTPSGLTLRFWLTHPTRTRSRGPKRVWIPLVSVYESAPDLHFRR